MQRIGNVSRAALIPTARSVRSDVDRGGRLLVRCSGWKYRAHSIQGGRLAQRAWLSWLSEPAGFSVIGLERPVSLSCYPALVDALHRTQFGVIITPRGKRPTFVNAYADRLLERRDGLVVTDTGLEASGSADTRALRDVIDLASRRQLAAPASFLLPRAAADRPLAVLVPTSNGEAADHATVFVCDPTQPPAIDQGSLCRLFGLTRAEAAFAGLLLMGQTVDQAAESLFVSVHTVRTHLKRILLKTDTGRQAELLRVLLTCSAQIRLD
jgi:DNA-binding CsgD family transcriptional regulator